MVTIKLSFAQLVTDSECPTCGFDSLRRVRFYLLRTTGVTTVADVTACGRCERTS